MRILVTGGAGFLGSHLCDLLIRAGHTVVCLDNISTGQLRNIKHFRACPNFEMLGYDIINSFPCDYRFDQIYHLASPASPPIYQADPVKTGKTNVLGALRVLEIAKQSEMPCRVLLASTSEIYGNPLEHPQTESYFGNTNSIGVRSCYDESKRMAETFFSDFHRQYGTDIRIARIFNTFGPRMRADDGRVISNFITQGLDLKPLTIYGDGAQTRSFCYVDDTVRGLHALMNVAGETAHLPVNIGNPQELTMLELATEIAALLEVELKTEPRPMPSDDPERRKPDITRAASLLGWSPTVTVRQGLISTISYFRDLRR